MSLNLLPAEKIRKRFYVIVEEVGRMDNALLKSFCNYVERQWIKYTIWPPTTWSMFMQHRRTKNNAEGTYINTCGSYSFYVTTSIRLPQLPKNGGGNCEREFC